MVESDQPGCTLQAPGSGAVTNAKHEKTVKVQYDSGLSAFI